MYGVWNRYLFPICVAFLYLFLYVPLMVLAIFSFNDNRLRFDWKGFTTQWYQELWNSTAVWHALQTSLIVAGASVLLCVTLGSLFVFFGNRTLVRRMLVLFYGNLVLPEIVLAVGLMGVFSLGSVPLSMTTLIAAHTVLGLGYAVPIIYDRYRELDKRYVEASMDLGATAWQTFYRVVLPLIAPSLVVSALLVFIISFDDFILSFFCASGSTQTLPIYIFSLIRSGSSPMVSALSTVLLLVSGLIILLMFAVPGKKRGFW